MTLRIVPQNNRVFTAEELQQFPVNRSWMGSWPASATVEIHSITADRFCWRVRFPGGASDGCGGIRDGNGQLSVLIPGVIMDTADQPFFRADNPVLWIGGLAILGVGGYFAYRALR